MLLHRNSSCRCLPLTPPVVSRPPGDDASHRFGSPVRSRGLRRLHPFTPVAGSPLLSERLGCRSTVSPRTVTPDETATPRRRPSIHCAALPPSSCLCSRCRFRRASRCASGRSDLSPRLGFAPRDPQLTGGPLRLTRRSASFVLRSRRIRFADELGSLRLTAVRTVLAAPRTSRIAWVRCGSFPGRYRPTIATHVSFIKLGTPRLGTLRCASHALRDTRFMPGCRFGELLPRLATRPRLSARWSVPLLLRHLAGGPGSMCIALVR